MNATIREQRRRKAVDESLTQNAEEKKRLLNVLAQRRYRARKRQRYLELERLQTSGDPAAKTPNEQFPLQENSVAMVCRDDTYANADVASANPDGDSRRSLSGFGLGNDFELPVVTSPDFRALWMPLGPQQSGNDRFSIPHSPVLDLLPWPAVRTKLITAFSLPESDRPIHSDGQRVNLMKFAHDIEDGGVRIWGPNPLDEKAWEVQPEFVQKWWWALDGQVLQMADRRRRERGEQRLRIDGFLT
ncbi:hypothetical protein H2203_006723 [Taxawa tesnikishii (nom. ined.)]|nr:hypothetical protein H2203_006723 [Dothideales sp. JES 119]